ncbi:MAG TPA: lysophospholipid acyltransferase family protein [Xanthomonadales bacterium]|nr:lysophospholipid acyltransferase family protein [Xanthomonadales bacterium]
MRKTLFYLYQLYLWLVLVPLVLLLTFLSGLATALSATWVNPRFANRHFARNWARLLAWLTPMRVSVHGAEHAQTDRSYVVVCNHQSQYDILLVYGFLDLDFKWVIKQELRKIPGLGIGCEKAGHIFIDRSNPRSARAAVAAALQRLGDGVGILFFPEGTRSLDGRLLPFKRGAFRLAIEQQLPVLPVTLVGTRDIMPAKTLRVFPGRARLIIHPAIETRGMVSGQVDELLNRAQKTIASALPPSLR